MKAWTESIFDRFCSGLPQRDTTVWDALLNNVSIGRVAVAVAPNKERVRLLREELCRLTDDDPASRPQACRPRWLEALLDEAARVIAGMQLPGDGFPALEPPRFVYGQSQGLCDLFGARVEPQDNDLYYVHPLQPEPAFIGSIEPKPLETSIYYNAVRWIRYARRLTGGRFQFRNSVMTSPFDTANNLLGTTVLMEWVYTEPQVLHRLLNKITSVIMEMIGELRDAAGGALHAAHFYCIRNAFDLASECRSIVSTEVYEEFEAPYLRMIGEQLGAYAIHSCGNWEHTVSSAIRDPNLRAMHGQVRENDLSTLCKLANGRLTLAIGESKDLDERFTWPDRDSFLRHVLETIPDNQPAEVAINEDEIETWNALARQVKGEENLLFQR